MPGGSKKGGGLESSPTYKKKSMVYNKKAPFKMKGHTLPGPAQRRATMSGDPAFAPDAEAMEDTMAMKSSMAKGKGHLHSDHHGSKEGSVKGEDIMPTPPPERQAVPKKKSMAKHIDGFEDTLPHKHRGRKISKYVKKKKR
jgi:hypothetical protein